METTLHNHVRIGENGNPLIPNVIFKGLLHLVSVKDWEAVSYILKNYSLAPTQKQLYQQEKEKYETSN